MQKVKQRVITKEEGVPKPKAELWKTLDYFRAVSPRETEENKIDYASSKMFVVNDIKLHFKHLKPMKAEKSKILEPGTLKPMIDQPFYINPEDQELPKSHTFS
jgi:hypothetical protein